jgi:hypothetical protein
MEQELKGQEKELTDDINNLNKKVCPIVIGIHATYTHPRRPVKVKIPREAIH